MTSNPYIELEREQQESQWTELASEWQDIVHRQQDLSLEASVNQEHRKLCGQALGIGVLCVSSICGERHETN